MGRRYRRKEPFIIEFIEMITKAPYEFGVAVAIVFGILGLLIPELFSNDEFGKKMLIHVAPTLQWLFFGIAGISLLAAVYSFFTNR